MVRATELLLQERMPRGAPAVEPPDDRDGPAAGRSGRPGACQPAADHADTPGPRTHLLSNGRYTRDGHQRRRRATAAATSWT